MGLFGRSRTVTLDVEGMTCNHCVMRVRKALEGVGGVKEAKVDLASKRATVKVDAEKVDDTALVAAVEDAGYKAKVG